jgi:Ca-activated chloride channel homolog
MRLFAPFLVIGLLVLASLQAARLPPPQPGIVTGIVVNQAGAAIDQAIVELRSGARVVQTMTTDASGRFRFEGVTAGTYQLRLIRLPFNEMTMEVVVAQQALAPLRLTLVRPDRASARQTPPIASPESKPEAPRTDYFAPPTAAAAARANAKTAETVGGAAGGGRGGRVLGYLPSTPPPFNTEAYDRIEENQFRRVSNDPLSTFSIDVDTASYSNVRRFLNDGSLPPPDAVRVEELINYFRFGYKDSPDGAPFSVTTEVAACPWNPRHRLALIGLQAKRLTQERTPPRNLVFLLDVSGSMMPPDKLPLVKTAMRMLVDTLNEEDRVAIVIYAGASGLALPSTHGSRKAEIKQAIETLRAGGSTNGAEGIRLAYDIAARSFLKEGINRVILATDGDFNVGVTNQGELIRLIEEKREHGIFLSVLGVGTGNLKDSTMEKLADKGNGNYAYLDSLHEARRVLIAEAGATLVTVAKDVKIQVEFNPRTVGAYKLIGYENRILQHQDFNNDKKDAGEIGAGHTVTALYEIVPPGESIEGGHVDSLKYQDVARPNTAASQSGELMTVKLRYKQPDGDTSKLISMAVRDRTSELTPNLGFAAAVAEFGMLLRRSEHKGQSTWTTARELARRHRGEDPDGYRAELIKLIELAAALDMRVEETDRPITRRR